MNKLDIDAIHRALASPVRRNILAWLRTPHDYFEAQPVPFSLGVGIALVETLTGLAQSTVSAHLTVLRNAGLIRAHQLGRATFLQRDEQTIQGFISHMRNVM